MHARPTNVYHHLMSTAVLAAMQSMGNGGHMCQSIGATIPRVHQALVAGFIVGVRGDQHWPAIRPLLEASTNSSRRDTRRFGNGNRERSYRPSGIGLKVAEPGCNESHGRPSRCDREI